MQIETWQVEASDFYGLLSAFFGVCVSVFRSYTAGLGDFACSGLFCFRESVGLLVLSCRGEEFALNFSGYGRGVLL